MLRFSELRLDASTLRDLPDGGIRVTAQLTRPGIFTYRNPDGSPRREYRPAEEVFKKTALETFAGAAVTLNHPRADADGQRLVTAKTWKREAVGHLGENIREDAGHVVADLYIRDEAVVKSVKNGDIRNVSCGYRVDYDATPGETPEGQKYDGVQRGIRSNHVALLPVGVSPRGGESCSLRLDSNGDEITELKYDSMELDDLKVKVTALESELSKARTDAAELPKVKAELDAANKRIAELGEQVKPERLDALSDARSAVVSAAKAAGIDCAGKPTLTLKRAIVAKRTPDLAARVDSLSEESVDAIMAVYKSDAVAAPLAVLDPPKADNARTDAAPKVPTYAEMYEKHATASRNAWKNNGEKVN